MFSTGKPRVLSPTRLTKHTLAGILFAVLTLASSVAFLIGCMAPGVRELAIYRVDVAQLADELAKPAASPARSINASTSIPTKADLLHPALPPYWFYGISGICDFYTDSARISATGQAVCRQAFPPNQNVLAVVEASLRSGLALGIGLNRSLDATVQEDFVSSVVSLWGEALTSPAGSKLLDNEARVSVQSKASAALVIVAILFDFPSWVIAFKFGEHPWGKTLANCLGFSSMVLAAAAGACAILAMNGGMHGTVSGVGNVSGSLVFLFIGALLKILAVELLVPRPLNMSHEEIGAMGEAFMFNWFQQRIPDFSVQNWSSHIHPTEQWKYADFTYTDHEGYMTEALRGAGVPIMPYWRHGTQYHLEVKSTQKECNSAPFFVSRNQINMMQHHNNGPDAYIVARVFRVGTKSPSVRFFPRPWQWFPKQWENRVRGDLEFGIANTDGDTPVFVRS